MHKLLHEIPHFFILFLEQLFKIFNRMLSIGSFGMRDFVSFVGLQSSRLGRER